MLSILHLIIDGIVLLGNLLSFGVLKRLGLVAPEGQREERPPWTILLEKDSRSISAYFLLAPELTEGLEWKGKRFSQ